jgi:hypothetical protein
MEFTVIKNRTHLKLVHKTTHNKGSEGVLQLVVHRFKEVPVYYLSR